MNSLELAFVTGAGLDFPVNTSAYANVCGNARGALCMYCSVTIVNGFGDLGPRALYEGVTSATKGWYYAVANDLPKFVP